MFEQKPLYREEHLLGKIIVTKIYLIKLILRRKFDDLTDKQIAQIQKILKEGERHN